MPAVLVRFLAAVLLAAVLPATCGCAKPPAPPVLGVLMTADYRQPTVDGLIDGLKALGYEPGRSIRYVVKNAQGDAAALPALARELADSRPAIICPVGGEEAEACVPIARQAGVPVVFMGVSNPVEHGIAKSRFEPLPGTTGVATDYVERMPKRMQVVTFFFPDVKTVTVLYEPKNVASVRAMELCQEVAPRLGLAVQLAGFNTDGEIRDFMAKLSKADHQLMLITPSPIVQNARNRYMVPASLRSGVPLFGLGKQACVDGAVIAYGSSFYTFGQQGARMAANVLLGTSPEIMPIELPETLELSINLKVADQIGLRFPPRWLGLTDFVAR